MKSQRIVPAVWTVGLIAIGGSLVVAAPSSDDAGRDGAPAATVAEEVRDLFATGPEVVREGSRADDPHEQSVTRRRTVLVRPGALPTPVIGQDGVAGAEGRVELNLFEDLRLTATIERVAPGAPERDGYVLVGRIEGHEESSVFLSLCGDALIGDVFAPGLGEFQVRYLENGVHEAREVRGDGEHGCGVGPEQHVAAPPAPGDGGEAGAGGQRSGGAGSGFDVDVMIAFTNAARNQAGSEDAMYASLASWVAQTNAAYANSQIKQHLRLVRALPTGYTESNSAGTDLARLRDTSDGFMDDLHAVRDEYGADLVHLASQSVGVCGIAYLMTNVSTGFASSGFGVTVFTCGALTFAHELGHNMGCAHDHDNAGGSSHCFAYGHRTSGNAFRTIMSYAPGTRISYFSNPNVLFGGEPIGVSGAGCPGNAADNARAINQNSVAFAQFRPTKFEVTGPGEFGLLNPPDMAAGVSTTPTLTWQSAQDAIAYSLMVSPIDDLAEPVFQFVTGLTGASIPPGAALLHNTTYYWGVTAIGVHGLTVATPVVSSFRTLKISDFNRDGVVNGTDLAVLLGLWGPTSPGGDLTGDDKVDSADLAVLLGEWG